MSTPLVDRFHFMAKVGQQTKTPIRAEAPEPRTADGVAVLRLYDPIDWDGGFWGVSAKEFTTVLDELGDDIETIQLHVNSPGGMVWDGLAIMNALRQHPARVVVIVDGIAASAASFIAMAGDEVVMAQGAEMMIHSPLGVCVGNTDDMAKMAKDLAHETDNLARTYQARAGGDLDDWRSAMAVETWYSAEEAVAAGLADRVLDTASADQPKARFDLSPFAYAGRAAAPPPAASAAPRSPATTSVSGSTENPEESMSLTDAQVADLRTRLGITDENADGDTILAALDEALSEQTPDPTPALSPDALAEVTRLSTELAEFKAQATARTKDEHFASWLRDGKTSAAEREQLEAMYDAAPEQTIALVSARAKGSVVPVDAIGKGEETADPGAVDDYWFPGHVAPSARAEA